MPRRKWGFDEDLSQVLWRQLLRGPRPPSVQWPHSRRNTSAVDHQVPAAKKGKGKGSGPAKGVGKGSHQQAPRHNATGQSVAVPKQRVPMSPDQVVEAARSRVAQTQASARHVGRRGRHVPCRPGSTLEGRVPSTRTTCVRAHPVDQKFCRTERKASRTGQGSNRESARGSELGHGLSEGGGKVARRGRIGGLQS